MKKKSIVIFILLCMFVLAACANGNDSNGGNSGDGASSSPEKLIVYTHFPGDNELVSQGLQKFADLVEEKTEGKLEMEVHTGGDLNYANTEILDAVNNNLVNIANVPMNEVTGDEPAFRISTVPRLIKTFEEQDIFHEIARPYFTEILEEKWNQKYLYGIQWPFAGFWTTEEVNSVDDLQGLQMRTYDESTSQIVREIGASPLSMGFGEVYSSLSTGVINSVLTSSQTAVDGKFWEVLDYFMPANIAAPRHYVTINLDAFNSLDEEIQNAMMEAASEMEEYSAQNLQTVVENTEGKVTEEGIEKMELSEEFIEVLDEAGKRMEDAHMEDATEVEKQIYEEFKSEIE